MEQRFAVLAEGATPKIYKLPINQTARLINEVPGRRVEVFETLNDAGEAALTLVESAKANARSGISILSNDPDPDSVDEKLLKTVLELTEGRVEGYYTSF